MKTNEMNFYDKRGNWDFSHINYVCERKTDWNYYDEIRKNTNEKSLCLDIGTGGGENVLKKYPEVGMIIATDLSSEMIKTAKKNLENYPEKKVKFVIMDNLKMTFPNEVFDLVSARHTKIDAQKIYDCLNFGGALVIEGVDRDDCIEIKDIFGRGQCYKDEVAISEIDYTNIKKAGFSKIDRIEILEDEYYETEEDLLALLDKTPILDEFSELSNSEDKPRKVIEEELFEKYCEKYKTDKGILLKRRLYGIVAIK